MRTAQHKDTGGGGWGGIVRTIMVRGWWHDDAGHRPVAGSSSTPGGWPVSSTIGWLLLLAELVPVPVTAAPTIRDGCSDDPGETTFNLGLADAQVGQATSTEFISGLRL